MGQLYMIPDRSQIEETLRLASKYNAVFEYNDFFLPSVLEDEEKVKEIIEFYRSLNRDRSRDTLHGAFFDVTIHSDDPQIRDISERRVRQSMKIASELGIRGVIFHTNFIPNFRMEFYLDNWKKRNAAFFKSILNEYPDLEVFVENMFDEEPDHLLGLAELLQEEPNFGICFDYAHACVFGDGSASWSEKLGKYTKHMHINDNDFVTDLHDVIGKGKIDWELFDQRVRQYVKDASVLIETSKLQNFDASAAYLKERHLYPFD